MTEQDEEKELAAAEATVKSMWAEKQAASYEFSRACNVRHCGADKRSVHARPAGNRVFLSGPTATRKWFDDRIAELGHGTFQARRRRLLSMRVTAQELVNMGRKL